jgi:hypothetical protein
MAAGKRDVLTAELKSTAVSALQEGSTLHISPSTYLE